MNIENLLDLLEIESSHELQYFEEFAELAEYEGDIPVEALADFFAEADTSAICELTEAYFEEILTGVPDEETDLFILLTSIGKKLSAIAELFDTNEGSRYAYADEFYSFRSWYTREENVKFTHGRDGMEESATVLEALALVRAENTRAKNRKTETDYDFSGALDYEIEEYSVPLSHLREDEEDEDEDEIVIEEDE